MNKSVIYCQNMTFEQLKASCVFVFFFFPAEQKIPQKNNNKMQNCFRKMISKSIFIKNYLKINE